MKKKILRVIAATFSISILLILVKHTLSSYNDNHDNLSKGLHKITLGKINNKHEYKIILMEKNASLFSFIPTKNISFANYEVEILFTNNLNTITLYRRIPSIAPDWREIIRLPRQSANHVHQLLFILEPDALLSIKPYKNNTDQEIIIDLSKLT